MSRGAATRSPVQPPSPLPYDPTRVITPQHLTTVSGQGTHSPKESWHSGPQTVVAALRRCTCHGVFRTCIVAENGPLDLSPLWGAAHHRSLMPSNQELPDCFLLTV